MYQRNDSDSFSGILKNIQRTIPKIFSSEGRILFKNITFIRDLIGNRTHHAKLQLR